MVPLPAISHKGTAVGVRISELKRLNKMPLTLTSVKVSCTVHQTAIGQTIERLERAECVEGSLWKRASGTAPSECLERGKRCDDLVEAVRELLCTLDQSIFAVAVGSTASASQLASYAPFCDTVRVRSWCLVADAFVLEAPLLMEAVPLNLASVPHSQVVPQLPAILKRQLQQRSLVVIEVLFIVLRQVPAEPEAANVLRNVG